MIPLSRVLVEPAVETKQQLQVLPLLLPSPPPTPTPGPAPLAVLGPDLTPPHRACGPRTGRLRVGFHGRALFHPKETLLFRTETQKD